MSGLKPREKKKSHFFFSFPFPLQKKKNHKLPQMVSSQYWHQIPSLEKTNRIFLNPQTLFWDAIFIRTAFGFKTNYTLGNGSVVFASCWLWKPNPKTVTVWELNCFIPLNSEAQEVLMKKNYVEVIIMCHFLKIRERLYIPSPPSFLSSPFFLLFKC